jgi:alkyl hydroperoxide reductase subunit AhpC
MIGDTTLAISKLYGMLPAAAPPTSDGRTAADHQTIRTVFVIDPDKKIKLLLSYPTTTGRNLPGRLARAAPVPPDRASAELIQTPHQEGWSSW